MTVGNESGVMSVLASLNRRSTCEHDAVAMKESGVDVRYVEKDKGRRLGRKKG